MYLTDCKDYIEPNYPHLDVDVGAIRKEFNTFMNTMVSKYLSELACQPSYIYNSNIGLALRSADISKDAFVKAVLANSFALYPLRHLRTQGFTE